MSAAAIRTFFFCLLLGEDQGVDWSGFQAGDWLIIWEGSETMIFICIYRCEGLGMRSEVFLRIIDSMMKL